MIKELFGWLIAVCRRWAVGCSYDSKTDRARYGLSIICNLYLMGIVINVSVFITPVFFELVPGSILVVLYFITFILPLVFLKRVYPNDVAEFYIQRYQARDISHNTNQQLLALLFCLMGFFTMFGQLRRTPIVTTKKEADL